MLKGESWIKKLEYFWMYYKTPFLVALAVIAAASYWICAASAEKASAFYAMLVDCYSSATEEEMAHEFAGWAGIDTGSYDVTVNASLLFQNASSNTYAMTSLSRFYSDIGTEKLDVCGFLEDDFEKYAKTDTFLDLRQCFSKEELDEMDEYLYIKDGKPLGIYAEGLTGLEKYGCYRKKKAILGIVYNSGHVKTAAQYLSFLFLS